MTNSRNKGQRGEREVAKILSEELGFPIKRILDQTREGGHDISIPGYAVEVKFYKRLEDISLPAAIRQARRSASDSGIDNWAVVYRSNHSPWRVVLSTDLQGLATLSREEMKTEAYQFTEAGFFWDGDKFVWRSGPKC